MSDHKFKVGDKVIRTQGNGALAVGTVCTVERVSDAGGFIDVGTGTGWHDVHNFEHYVEREAVLTPLKVAEYLLAGVPELEYRGECSGHWYTVKHPHLLCIKTVHECTFRVKPQPVKVNGIDVPKPVKLPEGTVVWYPAVGCNVVQRGRVSTSLRTYWATKEDAQAVLDAILTSFSK